MRPLYRAWLQFAVWLGGMLLWLYVAEGEVCWWQPAVIWLLFIFLFFVTKKFSYPAGALPLVSLLVLLGWLFLYRLDPNWAGQQFWGILVGAAAYLIGLFTPLAELDLALLAAAGSVGPLAATALFGRRIGGAKAWLTLGGITFQPVEFARVFLIIYLSYALAGRSETGNEQAYWGIGLKTWGLLALFFLLLALQTDLGPALLVFLVFGGLFLTINFSWQKLALYLGLAGCGLGASLLSFAHLRTRMLAWLRPWNYLESKGYQILQGLFALNAGGAVGRGLGAGLAGVIPAVHTDYLLALMGEELGLLGTFSLFLIYLGLAFWALNLLSGVADLSLRLVGLGFTLLLHIQVFLVAGGILRLVPFTGMTLPFISYGSSSLVAQLWMLGMTTRLGREKL